MKFLVALRYNLISHWENRTLVLKLAVAEARKQTIRTSLGIVWIYIRDITYFVVYALFRLLVAGSGKVNGMSAVLYVVLGLVPWLFINDVLNKGSTIIKKNKSIIKSIAFPTTILPTAEVLCIFIQKLFNMGIAFVITFFLGDWRNISLIGVVYYTFTMVILMVVVNSIVSAFVAISGDFQQFYLAIIRVMIYTLPIIWSFEKISNFAILTVLKLNPMVYVIEGFRDSFTGCFTIDPFYTVYFYIFIFVLLLISSYTQCKLSKFYSDLM